MGGLESNDLGAVTGMGPSLTRIATVGYEPPALYEAEPAVIRFKKDLGPSGLQLVADALKSAVSQGAAVLAILPRWAADPGRRALETVTAARAAPRLILHESLLPPLGGSVLVAIAAAIAPLVGGAGLLAAALPRIERDLVTGAWLSSVAGLHHPSPSLSQHAASMVPWSSFAVIASPLERIAKLTRKRASIEVPRPRQPYGLLIADRDGNPEWVRRAVLPNLGSPPTREVKPTELGPTYWGTPRLTEFAAYPVDIAAFTEHARAGLMAVSCRWCGEEIVADPCPFCGVSSDAIEEEVVS
jgi:hypothetical protein